MRADGGRGGTVDPRPRAGHTCESCGRHPATEALQRPPSQKAETTKHGMDHQVALCYQCWLDVLCGLKPMPPERAVTGALGTTSRSRGRPVAGVHAGGGLAGEHLRTRSRESQELEAEYSSFFQAHGLGHDDPDDRRAVARAARALRSHAARAREGRARPLALPPGTQAPEAPSAAFLRLRSAHEAVESARAQGFPARQERADFHEALVAFRHRATTVCRRARRLGAPAGTES